MQKHDHSELTSPAKVNARTKLKARKTKNDEKEFSLTALNNFSDYIRENNIICEQIKFHPLLKNYQLLNKLNFYKIYKACDTVTIDCSNEIDFMWSEIYKKNRAEN